MHLDSSLNASIPIPSVSQGDISSNVRDVVIHALAKQHLLREKSHRAVIENLPEADIEEATAASNSNSVQTIVHAVGVVSDLRFSEIHRHGKKRPNWSGYPQSSLSDGCSPLQIYSTFQEISS